MLSPSRVALLGETPHAHEREAIEFAKANIPDRDPFHLWALFELQDPSSGRLYEIDLLVLGYSALYLIEVKSGPGTYHGDSVDWYRTPPGETRSLYMDPPLRLANHKAKVLKSRLLAKMKQPGLAPRVEALVFLSHQDTKVELSTEGRLGVITRDQVARAVTRHEGFGAPPGWRGKPISAPASADIAQALKAIGIRPRKGLLHVGSYLLGGVLQEGPGYQDRSATHRSNERIKARARTYLVPAQTAVERRQQLLRAADREASLLYDVREHPNVLEFQDFVTDAAVGPTVLLEAFEGSEPLGAYLRKRPELPFQDRVELVLQVGRALAHCHRKGVVHGALSPETVLVRDVPGAAEGKPRVETRLFSFQLGHGDAVDSTRHRSVLIDEPSALYQAPELRFGSESATPAVDIYGLGAVAYLVFTGKAPGESVQEVDAQLKQLKCLDPAPACDSLHEQIAEWVRSTTDAVPVERNTDLQGWLDILEHEARELAAEPTADTVDPLQSRPGDLLEHGFMVERVLGHGATARALQVASDRHKGSLALKVSLGEEHDDRLRQEGEQLQKLHHEHIVPWLETLAIGARTCLLIGLAGEKTLDRYLAEEGTVSLEFGSRYGEDLLSALEALEEASVLHRDIKPANVGVRSVNKLAHHLTLFDFSLAGAPKTDVRVGTSAYRDPYLAQRGTWDPAADRWSAAVTLHEMLTGIRPSFAPDQNPTDPAARVSIASERFDASARESLAAFFQRALHPEAEQRYGSARDMRLSWLRAFEAHAVAVPMPAPAPATAPAPESATTASDADPHEALSDVELAAITSDTLIRALPLTVRAANALDRAGLLHARDLLALPDNQLSLIRGIGSKVAKEILGFRRRWQAAANLQLPEPTSSRPPTEPTREGAAPTTLEGWVTLLFAGTSKPKAQLRALWGLDAPFAGSLDVPARDVASHFGLGSPAGVYISHRKCRQDWAERPELRVLSELCSALLASASGVLRQDEAASALLSHFAEDLAAREAATDPLRIARAIALFRAVADVEQDRAAAGDVSRPGFVFARVDAGEQRASFFLADAAAQPFLEQLGRAADDFAARSVLAAPTEILRALAAIVEVPGCSLATTPPARLIALAALASAQAARSAALELYPRGLPAERAVELSAASLSGVLTVQDVQRRVAARYPEGQSLPDRPALDALLEGLGLRWDEAAQKYARPQQRGGASVHTLFATTTGGHHTRVAPNEPASLADAQQLGLAERPRAGIRPGPDKAQADERDFDDALRETLERGQLRALAVTAVRASDAALALAHRLGVEPVLFDQRLVAEMRALLQSEGSDPDVIYEIDGEDEKAGDDWHELQRLAADAAERLADALLQTKAPLLLCQPGLIARFHLDAFVKRMADAADRDGTPAILLLVPVTGEPAGMPVLNGNYRLPHLHPWQRLWLPTAWVKRHLPPALAPLTAHA